MKPTQAASGSIPAILLAAGLGTRLRPITNTIPKCLVPIHGRPLLDIWLEMLIHAGLGPIYVNIHHHAQAVKEYLAASPWRDAVHLSPETALLGTGGTLLAHRRQLDGGTFFVAHADNLSRFDVAAFLCAHQRRPPECVLTMMTFETDQPSQCGIVELDQRGVVTTFFEKCAHPPGNKANGAVFAMEPVIFDMFDTRPGSLPEISLDLLPYCLGRIATFHNDVYHRDIGTPESYACALQEYR